LCCPYAAAARASEVRMWQRLASQPSQNFERGTMQPKHYAHEPNSDGDREQ